jgi:flagellar FliL protein
MSPQNDPNQTAENPEAAGQPEAKKKKGIPKIAIYAAIGVVVLAVGYFAATSFMKKSGGEETQTAGEEKEKPEKEAKKENKAEGKGLIFSVADIIVNPSGTSGTRFLSASISFEVGSPATVKLFEEREPLIRDALITILGSKTMEQLSDAKQKEITRYQIRKRVEQLLKVDDLAAVYFTDFILQ